MSLLRRFGDFLIFNRFVSSSKCSIWKCLMFKRLMSFIYIKKINVPNTDPLGTTQVMVDISEL